MGIFDRFPYSSTHEMNLDFMLGKATEIAAGMQQVETGLEEIGTKTEQATQAAAQAVQAASSIEGSVSAAEEAAEEAQMHNESAQTWANNAMTYKADCQRAASEAAASSTAAAQAATAAAASEDTVATYAQAANASAQSAANNNDSAHQYANQASASASNATFHSSNAQTAATNAQTAATNAQTAASNAASSASGIQAAADHVETLVESLPEDFTDLNNEVNKNTLAIKAIGYNQQHIFILAGNSHPASSDILPIEIPTGKTYAITMKMSSAIHPQIYAIYSDGTSDRIYIYTTSTYLETTIIRTAEKDIVGFGTYISTVTVDTTIDIIITMKNAMSGLFGYAYITPYYIMMPDGNLYFEEGRSRIDVDTIHQSIAVYNNQVWEFGEGKAAYNNVQYSLENGHANCCNWGTTLHGTYPYLYCPLLTNNNINVFSFDGTVFTLVDTITIQTDITGNINAYIDETNGFIYGFIFSTYLTYFVADMEGNILFSKRLMYNIETIQNIKLHDGVLYIVSGFGTTANPNYLSIVSTDGTMLGRYRMSGIAEIEGIDFLDDKMILASYYNFYINPVMTPKTVSYGYVNQLKATT